MNRKELKSPLQFSWIILIVCLIVIYLLIKFRRGMPEKDKIVVILRQNNQGKYLAESIELDDCRDSFIELDKNGKKLLYMNYDNEIIEMDLTTEKLREVKISNSEELLNGEVSGPKYALGYQGISFINQGNIYLCDETGEGQKLVDGNRIMGNYTRSTYEWNTEESILYIGIDEMGITSNLYYENLKNKEKRLIEKSIESVKVSNNREKIFAISMYSVPHAFGFETKNKLIEIDLLKGINHVIKEINTSNFLLECVDNKYVFYVKENKNRKKNKIFCLDLENGSEKCVYETNEQVIGLIVPSR